MEKSSISSKKFDSDSLILFSSAAEEFQKALQSLWSSAEHEKNVIDSFARYSSIMQEAMQRQEVVEAASEAYAQYERSIQEAFDSRDIHVQLQSAFEKYLETIGEGWTKVNISSMTPQELAALAEGMSWVAGVVGTIARLSDADNRQV